MDLLEEFPPDTLVHVAFCSEANFTGWANAHGPQIEISRILYPTPRTAHHESIGGIFHCGDHHYLQIVEGPVEDVAWYIATVEADARHKRVEILHAEAIERHRFRPGAMRFVGSNEEMHRLNERHSLDSFDPYKYTQEVLRDFAALDDDRPSDPAKMMGIHRD